MRWAQLCDNMWLSTEDVLLRRNLWYWTLTSWHVRHVLVDLRWDVSRQRHQWRKTMWQESDRWALIDEMSWDQPMPTDVNPWLLPMDVVACLPTHHSDKAQNGWPFQQNYWGWYVSIWEKGESNLWNDDVILLQLFRYKASSSGDPT